MLSLDFFARKYSAIRRTPILAKTSHEKTDFPRKNRAPYNRETTVIVVNLRLKVDLRSCFVWSSERAHVQLTLDGFLLVFVAFVLLFLYFFVFVWLVTGNEYL